MTTLSPMGATGVYHPALNCSTVAVVATRSAGVDIVGTATLVTTALKTMTNPGHRNDRYPDHHQG